MSDSPSPILNPPRPRGEEIARKWRKRRSRLRRRLRRTGDAALIGLAIVAIVFGVSRAHSGGGKSTPTTVTAVAGSYDARYPPMHDVKVTGCAFLRNIWAGGVNLTVANHTLTRWSYYIDVKWKDGSQPFSETVLHSKAVPPLRAINAGAWGLATDKPAPKHHLTCSVVSVTRVGT